jgi:predicted small lipoprotein YifL
MKALIKLTAIAAAFTLAACGDKKEEEKKAEEMPAAEAPATSEGMSAAETMEKVAEALKLDTSSLEAFKESLANMKESLSAEESANLTNALSKLAANATDTGGDMMEAGKSMMKDMGDGKSVTEILYEKMAAQLDGKTFEDIMAMTG